MRVVVELKDGRKGFANLSEPLVNGKRKVVIMSKDYKKEEARLLVAPLSLKIIGYID